MPPKPTESEYLARETLIKVAPRMADLSEADRQIAAQNVNSVIKHIKEAIILEENGGTLSEEDENIVSKLLRILQSVEISRTLDRTFIHYLLAEGLSKEALFLIKRMPIVNVDNVDRNGDTILHLACVKGYLDIVKYLVEEGNANIFLENKKRINPIHSAIAFGQAAVVKYLLDRDCNRKFHEAWATKGGEVLSYLTAPKGTSETPGKSLNPQELKQVSETLVVLINSELDINAKAGSSLMTPLHQAIHNQDLGLCRMLLAQERTDREAIFLAQNLKYTPLTMAIQIRNMDFIKLLLEYDVDLFALWKNRRSPIHMALSCYNASKRHLADVTEVREQILYLILKRTVMKCLANGDAEKLESITVTEKFIRKHSPKVGFFLGVVGMVAPTVEKKEFIPFINDFDEEGHTPLMLA